MSSESEVANIPQLRFPEYSGEWEENRLGDICLKIQDGNYGANYPKADEFVDEGVPFLTSKAIQNNTILRSKIDYIPLEKHKQLKKAHLMLNDVLFTNRGSNVGNIAYVDEYVSNGNIGPQVTLLRTNEFVMPIFLFQYMGSSLFQKQVKSQDSGSAMNFFGIGQTLKFKVKLPPKQEQQKIAAFLTAVDTKIEQLSEKQVLLGEYKKGLMQKIFSQGIRFTADDGSDFPEWEERKLGGLCKKIASGKSKQYVDGQYDLYGSTGIIGKTEKYSNNGRYILVARVGVNAGLINIVEGKFGVTDNTLVIDLNETSEVDFVLYLLHKCNLNRLIFGSGQPLITGGQLKSLKLGLPAKPEQQKIASFLSSIDNKIEQVGKQLDESKQFKKALLQQMFV